MSNNYQTDLRTPVAMSASLRRTGSVTRSKSSMTPSVISKRSSAFLNASTPILDFGNVSPGIERDPMNEVAGLRSTIESLNKTNASLRSRIIDLENHIALNTGSEVERLSKELSTLEDLFASSQKANESHYAETERQKGYVKELENLLTTTLGSDWRESHDVYPPASTTTLVTASTPLPPPKPVNPLRHSVSFSGKRSTNKSHKRASSVMDLGLISLQAVKEDETNMDLTPTGALRKLSGSPSTQTKDKHNNEQQLSKYALTQTPEPKQGKPLPPTVSNYQRDDAHSRKTETHTSALAEVPITSNITSHATDVSIERNEQIGMMRKMLENQQKLLSDREKRLNSIIQVAKDKEERYATTI
ncbi:uncharacterized protein L201_002452 [Kwoniella dendrophila CBS 6074]|uniref:Uncharacterized protein n=1 Tax=Kwoniella dendrophila CBS 6074 TaxID=1295534 RepID=A0AAX4JQ72_9TREE